MAVQKNQFAKKKIDNFIINLKKKTTLILIIIYLIQ